MQVLSGAGIFNRTEGFFSIIYLASVFFQVPRYFQSFKNEKKCNVVSINKSTTRKSHFLSEFQKRFMVFRSPVCTNHLWCFTYAWYM